MGKKFDVHLRGELPEFKLAKRAFEKLYVETLLKKTNGHVTNAASLAGKDRKDFYALMSRAGVKVKDFRA